MAEQGRKRFGAVLVFGDIGRSPRMQNHAYEIASNTSYHVYLVGYDENRAYSKVTEHPKIQIVGISTKLIDRLKRLPKIFYLFYAISRILIQIFQLFWIFLFKLNRPDFILVQNPPSIPVLSTIWFVCLIKRIVFLVDFHNYGFTILALSFKFKPILFLARAYEKIFGKCARNSFCVSQAMKQDLKANWGINSNVLYDKPNTEIFRPIDLVEMHELLKRLNIVKTVIKGEEEETLLTLKKGKNVNYKPGRPLLLVSSTSWTKDEDFGILLEAMENYNSAAIAANGRQNFPFLLLLITGKGPEKEFYLKKIAEKQSGWKFISIKTAWLEASDYPQLLAAADLGICLHYSSSGVDLPMKIVDMFGAGLPVLAIDYKSIGELVEEDKNGQIFKNSTDLSEKLINLFRDWPRGQNILEKYKANINNIYRKETFHDVWMANVKPILDEIEKKKSGKLKKTN